MVLNMVLKQTSIVADESGPVLSHRTAKLFNAIWTDPRSQPIPPFRR